jgi:hypothetical protein
MDSLESPRLASGALVFALAAARGASPLHYQEPADTVFGKFRRGESKARPQRLAGKGLRPEKFLRFFLVGSTRRQRFLTYSTTGDVFETAVGGQDLEDAQDCLDSILCILAILTLCLASIARGHTRLRALAESGRAPNGCGNADSAGRATPPPLLSVAPWPGRRGCRLRLRRRLLVP